MAHIDTPEPDRAVRIVPKPVGRPEGSGNRLKRVPPTLTQEDRRRGALAKAEMARFSRQLGIPMPKKEIRRFIRPAMDIQTEHLVRFYQMTGVHPGHGVASMVSSAALDLAASRLRYNQGKYELSARLSTSSRQNLIAAYEMHVRESDALLARDVKGLQAFEDIAALAVPPIPPEAPPGGCSKGGPNPAPTPPDETTEPPDPEAEPE